MGVYSGGFSIVFIIVRLKGVLIKGVSKWSPGPVPPARGTTGRNQENRGRGSKGLQTETPGDFQHESVAKRSLC